MFLFRENNKHENVRDLKSIYLEELLKKYLLKFGLRDLNFSCYLPLLLIIGNCTKFKLALKFFIENESFQNKIKKSPWKSLHEMNAHITFVM